jgi:F-type H+-transporting ATPase subunit delta
MLNETVARRYCAALFALAKESATVDTVVNELDAFIAALRKDPDVRDFFFSPVVDRAQKTGLLGEALEKRLSELTFNFLVLLVRKRRENLVEVVARQMHELLDQDAGRTVAMIATPAPLSPQELGDLARRLSNVYRKAIIPQPRVDADLLGGLVVQMGDTYVDASVAGKLEEVRRHLLSTLYTATTAASPNGKSTA